MDVTLADPEARGLIERLNRELEALYPEDGTPRHFRLDPAEVAPGRGAFLLARLEGKAVACGAVRLLDEGTAEIKRMYTVPEARGRGLAAALLARLEQLARDLGARQVVLETGPRQREAVRLYERAGYRAIPPFGAYEDSPLSLFLGKPLAS
ncbi:MAG: GNAT family N-acetyltransferase [Candidatus Eremiobacterota bacterium]